MAFRNSLGATAQDDFTNKEFIDRYGAVITKARSDHAVVVAIDNYYRHYPVNSIATVCAAWRNGNGISSVVVLPQDLWALLKCHLDVVELF